MGGMKFRISYPEHSEFVQKKLFSLGFRWFNTGKKLMNTVDDAFLFAYDNKQITFTCGYGAAEHFNRHDSADMTNHPDWQWPRPSETSDIKARVYRNQTAKNIGERLLAPYVRTSKRQED